MTIWRLEWLRLARTRRLAVLLGVYAFLGLTGPVTARYLGAILKGLGTSGVQVTFPPPRPADGIAQYSGNAGQIGLLVVVLIAASALAFDGRREMAVFLRTRLPVRSIVLPAYAMNAAAAALSAVVGAGAAWYETVILLGPLPVSRMLLGVLANALFLAFAVAMTALTAAWTRSTLAAAGCTLAVLLAMAIVGTAPAVARYLPTALAGAMTGLVSGTPPSHFVPSTLIAIGATVACVAGAVAIGARHEV